MTLPKDPNILMSLINMKLRDENRDLDALCDDLAIDRQALEATLSAAGYTYDPSVRRFY